MLASSACTVAKERQTCQDELHIVDADTTRWLNESQCQTKGVDDVPSASE